MVPQEKQRLVTIGLGISTAIFAILFIVFVSLYATKTCKTCHDLQPGAGFLIEKHGEAPNSWDYSNDFKKQISDQYGELYYFNSNKKTSALTAFVVLQKGKKVTVSELEKFLNEKLKPGKSFLGEAEAEDAKFHVSDGNDVPYPSCSLTPQTTPSTTTVTTTTSVTKPEKQSTVSGPTSPHSQTSPATSTSGHSGSPNTPSTPAATVCPSSHAPTQPHQLEGQCHGVTSDIIFIADVLAPRNTADTVEDKFDSYKKSIKALASALTLSRTTSRIVVIPVNDKAEISHSIVYVESNDEKELEEYFDKVFNVTDVVDNDRYNPIHMISAFESIFLNNDSRPYVNTHVVVLADHFIADISVHDHLRLPYNHHTDSNRYLVSAIETKTPQTISASMNYFVTSDAFKLQVDSLSTSTTDVTAFLQRIVCNHATDAADPPPHEPPYTTTTLKPVKKGIKKPQFEVEEFAAAATTTPKPDPSCERFDILILIDVSESMDPGICKKVRAYLVNDLPNAYSADKNNYAVMTFADVNNVLIPFSTATTDADFKKKMASLSCNGDDLQNGSRLGNALEAAADMLSKQAESSNKNQVVITFTDGKPMGVPDKNAYHEADILHQITNTTIFVGTAGDNGVEFPNNVNFTLLDELAEGSHWVYRDVDEAKTGYNSSLPLVDALAAKFPCSSPYCKQVLYVMEITEITWDSTHQSLHTLRQLTETFTTADPDAQFTVIGYSERTSIIALQEPAAKIYELLHKLHDKNFYETIVSANHHVSDHIGTNDISHGIEAATKQLQYFYTQNENTSPSVVFAVETRGENKTFTLGKELDDSVKAFGKQIFDKNQLFGLDMTVSDNRSAQADTVFWPIFGHNYFPINKDTKQPPDFIGLDQNKINSIGASFGKESCQGVPKTVCDNTFNLVVVFDISSSKENMDLLVKNIVALFHGYSYDQYTSLVAYDNGKAAENAFSIEYKTTHVKSQTDFETALNKAVKGAKPTAAFLNLETVLDYVETNLDQLMAQYNNYLPRVLVVSDNINSQAITTNQTAACDAASKLLSDWRRDRLQIKKQTVDCEAAPIVYSLVVDEKAKLCAGTDAYKAKYIMDPLITSSSQRNKQFQGDVDENITKICKNVKANTDCACYQDCETSCGQTSFWAASH
ncbi:hypothetical protein L596_002033 [Steinernema carpocapsae]|uniref:VWFA domain-containing protein n=1 Tax=Steinernema carpocapsae TaxID=34508 RepID=A0A4U8UMV9_STECR|nr:hypothetical protein L596_002033 [Steinernema carpocapsae]